MNKEFTRKATILTSVIQLAFLYGFLSTLCSCQSSDLYSALAQSVEHAAVNRSVVGSSPTSGAIPVIMATRIHLFPFRTQKLSSSTAKVLDHPRSGRIASCRISKKAQSQPSCGCVLFLQLAIRQGRASEAFHSKGDTRLACQTEMSAHIVKGACGARASIALLCRGS